MDHLLRPLCISAMSLLRDLEEDLLIPLLELPMSSLHGMLVNFFARNSSDKWSLSLRISLLLLAVITDAFISVAQVI